MNSTMNFNQKTTKPLIMLCMTGFFVAGLQNKVLAEELVRTVEVSNEWKTGKQDEPVVLPERYESVFSCTFGNSLGRNEGNTFPVG